MQQVSDYPFLRRSHFDDILQKPRTPYSKAAPFPHAVIDNFLPAGLADAVEQAFPTRKLESFDQPDNAFQKNKLGRTQDNEFVGVPATIRHLLYDLNGPVFVNFLERLTGISGLIPDPHYRGGALHQILPGGFLKIHADFNQHRHLKLDRRLNVLIYFNKDWKPEYGGDLELWDRDMSACVQKVSPIFNRGVIFSTTSTSYHGHPEPLQCPPDRTRNSIAMYYYSNGRPESERRDFHSTLWQEPGAKPVDG
ncbi:2OG-Fe(II) oxygenase [Henriciella sp. AS95]|uniref:2OG-Fe(II) oxygenase n=1 Tax=Henriciella sp. AS95 TaxID=3135782 RepID=UPI0031798DBF